MHSSRRFTIRFWIVVVASSVAFIFPGFRSAIAQDRPTIAVRDGNFTLSLPSKMVAALKEFNAHFVPWKTSDYTQVVVEEVLKSGNPRRAPFALILDVNRDSVLDVILDGHDEKNSLLVCALSDGGGFNVVTVEQQDLVDPKTTVSLDGGKKLYGLNYFLWPTTTYSEDSAAPVLMVGYPQQSDADGQLLNDGAMISYFFEKGTFRPEVEVP